MVNGWPGVGTVAVRGGALGRGAGCNLAWSGCWPWQNELAGQEGTRTSKRPPSPGHRVPVEIICHAIWLYRLVSPSVRDIALILAERGIIVSCESIRLGCLPLSLKLARPCCRRRP